MLNPGTFLQNRYQIIRQLGAGGMGAVYLAFDQRLGSRQVVVKENQGGDPNQFQIEANILANLSHPNLPRVIDHFIDPSGAPQYLVMDYIEGQDLDALVQQQRGPLPESTVLQWMQQVFDAVGYLHANRIVHRDIKPENIIITPVGKAVLVDFGIAKQLMTGRPTLSGARSGTPGYAAPEQYRGGTDQRSDVYSISATLYAVFTAGAPPDSLAREKGTAILVPPRRINSAISQNTDAVIMTAMNLDPALRYGTVGRMRQALHAGQSVLQSLGGGQRPKGRPIPRNLVAVGGVAGLVLVCVIFLLVLLNFSPAIPGIWPVQSVTSVPRVGVISPTPALGTIVPSAPGTPHPEPTFTQIPPLSPTSTVAVAACTPPASVTNLVQVASEIPGTRLTTCSKVGSTIGSEAKPRDVFALDLVAGQEIRFSVVPTTSGYLSYALYNPGSRSIETKQASYAFSDSGSGRWARDFIPAVSGTYYFAIGSDRSEQRYTVTVSATGNSVAGNVAGEIPGTKLNVGSGIVSVVDNITKKRDVHAIDLVAGQEVRFTSEPASGSLNYTLYNPDSRSIETRQASLVFAESSSTKWARAFTPAASGTYYFAVSADRSEQRYALTVSATGNNVSGNVAGEIPGTKLSVGRSVVSVVDSSTKRRDVYAIDLTAGQEIRFTCESTSGLLNYSFYNPGSRSIETKQVSLIFGENSSGRWARDFIPAVSGTYYLAIQSGSSEQRYTLAVSATGNNVAGNVASEIPGTKLSVGSPITSVVDYNTKKRDVYAIDLVAGQEMRFTGEAVSGSLTFVLYNPDARIIETKQASSVFSESGSGKWTRDFTPAVSGTYYLAIQPGSSEQRYTLAVSVTGNSVTGNVVSEIPGTKLNVGGSITSVVDYNTKKRDVYAIDLVAGQEVRFTVVPMGGSMSFLLGSPASRSFEANQVTKLFSDGSSSKWVYDYTPTATGIFYLSISASGSGQTYSLSVVRR